jgi:nucleolar protein TMA23
MLDGHEYLTKRGWKGKGNALRFGGIAKPLVVTQKNSLSGLGKDRDEAFPFWEHVYTSSLKVINIKVHDSDTDSDNGEEVSCILFVLELR